MQKFFVQREAMDFTSNIKEVLSRTLCKTHGALRHGQACWWIHTDTGGLRAAVCGRRARKIYVGQSSGRSVTRNYISNRKPKESLA